MLAKSFVICSRVPHLATFQKDSAFQKSTFLFRFVRDDTLNMNTFGNAEKELIFYDSRHRNDFSSLLLGRRKKNLCGLPNYAAAVFLLSADENLWEKVSKQVLDTGIYFDRIRLGSVTLEQYILFHAARDVYLGTKHIRLSELTDRELIPDEILRLIVNAFVMERYGVDIVEREVWNED